MTLKIIDGILFPHCETGTEGVVWALQDFKLIDNTKKFPWLYKGLNEINNGDWLLITDPNNKIVWGGIVNMEIPAKHKEFYWNHGLPTNCDRDLWIEAFYGNVRNTNYIGKLIKGIYNELK